MARERPTASNDRQHLICLDGDRPDSHGPLLTLAEARALRRSAPLTHAQLHAHLRPVRAPRSHAI